MSERLANLLKERRWLLADGATGTNLFAVGLQSGDAPELWNFEHPDRIANLHRSFIDAGADIILTNTFGGNRYRLKLHKLQDQVKEINEAAAQIARKEADASDRPIIVAGSMGPTGEILQPVGPLSFEDAKAAFAEQGRALADGGADVLWIETISSQEEAEAAIAGASTIGLPVVCTLSFDTNGRTMMGLSPRDLAKLANTSHHPIIACGTNCGVGASEVVACIHNMATVADEDTVLIAKANCGIPEYVDGAIRYNGTPELMADYAKLVLDAGARIIGGCCGTTPEHIRAMRTALENYEGGPSPTLDTIVERLGDISSGSHAQWGGEENRLAGAAPGANTERKRGRRHIE